MMQQLYNQEKVKEAFRIYSVLTVKGYAEQDDLRPYFVDDAVRGLVDMFASQVNCAIISAGSNLYLIPMTVSSPFHISNDSIKRYYLGTRATNTDIYLMYVAIIVFFGEFYDSYQTAEPTRDFLPADAWLTSLNQRMEALKEIDPKELERLSRHYEHNWKSILEKWEAMDDLRETARVQDGRTNSRLSFLYLVRRFLESQELIADIGENQLILTEKAKTIIQRYYMDAEYNRGILEFLYHLDQEGDE